MKRYRSRFVLFWFRGDAAFAQTEVCEYCGGERITYFIRLPANAVLNRLIGQYLARPVGRPPKSGIQIRPVDLLNQAKTWERERGVVAMIEWHGGEPFPRIGFIATNSNLPAEKVVKVYNGRDDFENRIKEGKNTLRWDKTSCRRFAANQARLLMGVLAYNLLHMLRQFYLVGKRSEAVNGMAYQVFDQGRTECRVSRQEEASSCGFSLPLGPGLPNCVWMTSATEETVDGATEAEVRSET